MALESITIPNATRLPVQLVGSPVPHPTAGYREWQGQLHSTQPIVALVINIAGFHINWARTSHRASNSLETRILFAPYDSSGRDIQVCFGIHDAIAYCRTSVESELLQPAPILKEFVTGELFDVAQVPSKPLCALKALVLARTDVQSVRNGVWHARGNVVESLGEPWRTILTYGRSGHIETD